MAKTGRMMSVSIDSLEPLKPLVAVKESLFVETCEDVSWHIQFGRTDASPRWQIEGLPFTSGHKEARVRRAFAQSTIRLTKALESVTEHMGICRPVNGLLSLDRTKKTFLNTWKLQIAMFGITPFTKVSRSLSRASAIQSMRQPDGAIKTLERIDKHMDLFLQRCLSVKPCPKGLEPSDHLLWVGSGGSPLSCEVWSVKSAAHASTFFTLLKNPEAVLDEANLSKVMFVRKSDVMTLCQDAVQLSS